MWQCGSKHGIVRAMRTVRAAVCAAVRFVVYGTVHGSVRLSGSAAVCSSVRQCARLLVCNSARGGVRQCVGLCVGVSGSKHGSVRAMRTVPAAVCGSAIGSLRQCVGMCVAVPAYGAVSVWQCAPRMYIHKVAHNRYIYSLITGVVGTSPIFSMHINSNRSVLVINTN